MLWPCALKYFAEQLNLIKVDNYGITHMEKFEGTATDITIKITTNGAVQFMSWVQYYKEIYMYYTSGNPYHLQGYILFTHYFMQDQ